jgi:beta-hydroxylase
LRVPERAEDCWMECGGERIVWRDGELVFFDDTYPHAVWNNTDEERIVLLLDVERPMTPGGQRLSRLMSWLLRRTAYFKDAQRNQRAWEARYREFLALSGDGRAESVLADPTTASSGARPSTQ